MYTTKDGIQLVAVINRKTGVRYGEDKLTGRLGAYVENNRQDFSFVCVGDTTEPVPSSAPAPAADAAPAADTDEDTSFSVTDLKKLNKSALLDICESLQLTTQDSDTREDLINLIDEKQQAEATAKAAKASKPAKASVTVTLKGAPAIAAAAAAPTQVPA
jgi:hypothetical protein